MNYAVYPIIPYTSIYCISVHCSRTTKGTCTQASQITGCNSTSAGFVKMKHPTLDLAFSTVVLICWCASNTSQRSQCLPQYKGFQFYPVGSNINLTFVFFAESMSKYFSLHQRVCCPCLHMQYQKNTKAISKYGRDLKVWGVGSMASCDQVVILGGVLVTTDIPRTIFFWEVLKQHWKMVPHGSKKVLQKMTCELFWTDPFVWWTFLVFPALVTPRRPWWVSFLWWCGGPWTPSIWAAWNLRFLRRRSWDMEDGTMEDVVNCCKCNKLWKTEVNHLQNWCRCWCCGQPQIECHHSKWNDESRQFWRHGLVATKLVRWVVSLILQYLCTYVDAYVTLLKNFTVYAIHLFPFFCFNDWDDGLKIFGRGLKPFIFPKMFDVFLVSMLDENVPWAGGFVGTASSTNLSWFIIICALSVSVMWCGGLENTDILGITMYNMLSSMCAKVLRRRPTPRVLFPPEHSNHWQQLSPSCRHQASKQRWWTGMRTL